MKARGIILIVLLAVLVLFRYKINEGFQSAKEGPSVVICKAEWCGHCRHAAPEFEKLKSASPITLDNGSKATVTILDGDKDKEEVKKYNVRGYPTIIVVQDGKQMEYPGERTYDGVLAYLNQL